MSIEAIMLRITVTIYILNNTSQIHPICWKLQSLTAYNSKVNPCLLRRESIEAESQKERKKQRRKEKVEVVQGREPLYHENL